MTTVYVSPHLDDAAFSCAAGIVSRRAAGQRVVVITVFSEGEPAREVEDRQALARVGAEAIHLGLPDSPLRLGIAPTFRDLMLDQPLRPETIEAVAAGLRPHLAQLGPAEIWWPLGIGGHIDHRSVFAASRRLPGSPRYYEDRPYAFVPAFVALRHLELRGGHLHAPPTIDELSAQIDAGGCAAFFTPEERAGCVATLHQRLAQARPARGHSLRAIPHRHPGHGPAALALVQAYPSQLGWLMSGISAEALWRRWAFDADGEPFERELAIRGDIDDAPGVGGYGSPRDTA
ncbi:MAG: PIG-L family deacetylase [Myxococcales bacterium]|nr:PIG-L family deacetylase [Myxococcales bacterium]MCB9714821.1 PIG-L family deacetylase [Myxococcales bacterium]